MASPDIAVVTIGVISIGHTAQAALASNSSDMAAVIATIKAAGIEDKDVGNTGFNLNPIYPPERQPNPEQPVKIIGYRVCNDVRVIIRDFAKAGDVLAAPFDLPSLKGIICVSTPRDIHSDVYCCTDRSLPSRRGRKAFLMPGERGHA